MAASVTASKNNSLCCALEDHAWTSVVGSLGGQLRKTRTMAGCHNVDQIGGCGTESLYPAEAPSESFCIIHSKAHSSTHKVVDTVMLAVYDISILENFEKHPLWIIQKLPTYIWKELQCCSQKKMVTNRTLTGDLPNVNKCSGCVYKGFHHWNTLGRQTSNCGKSPWHSPCNKIKRREKRKQGHPVWYFVLHDVTS